MLVLDARSPHSTPEDMAEITIIEEDDAYGPHLLVTDAKTATRLIFTLKEITEVGRFFRSLTDKRRIKHD